MEEVDLVLSSGYVLIFKVIEVGQSDSEPRVTSNSYVHSYYSLAKNIHNNIYYSCTVCIIVMNTVMGGQNYFCMSVCNKIDWFN